MGSPDLRAVEKVSGPSWQPLRNQFDEISNSLLGISAKAASELTTIYVKFRVTADGPVYAVMWLKRSSELVVGIALPEEVVGKELHDPPRTLKYPGLTKYFTVRRGGEVPRGLAEWAQIAYNNVAHAVTNESSS